MWQVQTKDFGIHLNLSRNTIEMNHILSSQPGGT